LRIEEADQRITGALALFQAQELPLRWVLGPSSQPADLGPRLLARGLVQEDRPGSGTEHLGMAVDLRVIGETRPRPAGLTIRPVADAAGCRAWAAAARRGFNLSAEVADGWRELLDSLPFDPSLRHCVGWQDGVPVATAALLLGGGVAGIYYVSTASEARRQGIGRAMVAEALRAARAEGFRVGVLVAPPSVASLYRPIGFTEQCLFGIYHWPRTRGAGPQPL
jgi:ribosomal protein S18 acetylase RimI-like enzyme